MSLDVRTWKPGEKSKQLRRWLFWPLLIILIGVLTVVCIMVAPRWFGYDRQLEQQMVMVKVFDAPDTRSQVMVGVGNKTVQAPLPDMSKRGPDGSATVPLGSIVDPEKGPLFANKYVVIGNAQIQRVMGEDVIAVGGSPADEIFVHIPDSAMPSKDFDWGPQVTAKARVNVAGTLLPTPSLAQAKELFRIKDPSVENRPFPPVYLEASTIKVVETKPMFGDE